MKKWTVRITEALEAGGGFHNPSAYLRFEDGWDSREIWIPGGKELAEKYAKALNKVDEEVK